jgi:cell division protein FtsQ
LSVRSRPEPPNLDLRAPGPSGRGLPRPPAGPLLGKVHPGEAYAPGELAAGELGQGRQGLASGRPPVDPRFRRRWAEARRAEGRRRLRLLLALVVAGALVGGAFGALHSPLFEVRHVEVLGSPHTSKAQVEKAAGLSAGSLMVDVGSASAVRAVDRLPWVASVTFERRWPWTVVVKVTERRPAALVLLKGGAEVVDASGRALEMVPSAVRLPPLPVVNGALGAEPGRRVRPLAPATSAGLALALQAASVTPRSLAARHLVLSWSDGLGIEARVGNSHAVVILGDGSELAYKMAVLAELAARVQLSNYSFVDLTVPERPALTPVTGT